jgi:hypothetical protein
MIRRLFVVVVCWGAAPAALLAASPDFQRDVRPILAKHCLKCHGPDEHGRQGGLRLDLREAALRPAESGERAIVPGDVAASEMLRRVTSADDGTRMPPGHAGPALNAAQVDVLSRWIAGGAEYTNHWAFEPVRRPAPPAVKNSAWVRNPIDSFVLAKLEAAGLTPAAEAEPQTLVRRLYLDLIGLPPTPEQAAEFVADSDPAAYEKLVDRLLASPHYGERWARRWLDLARYSDTNGYEKDRERSIWPYRDWVIRALNDDLPFDEFTIRQLAGDMLPGATNDDRIATGFHRNTMLNEEGGIDPLEFRYYAMTDRVATTGAVWLGLTLQCAQCHTHKFDPIRHEDYYRFLALLNNADEPEMEVNDEAVAATRERVQREIDLRESRLAEQFPPAVDFSWRAVPAGRMVAARGTVAVSKPDGAVSTSEAREADTAKTLLIYGDAADVRGLRMSFLPPPDDDAKGRSQDTTPPPETVRSVIQEITVNVISGAEPKPRTVRVLRAETDHVQSEDGRATETFDASVANAFDGDASTGWIIVPPRDAQSAVPRATFVFNEPIKTSGVALWIVTLRHPAGSQSGFDRLRLEFGSERPSSRTPAELSSELLARRFQAWLDGTTSTAVDWRTVRPAAVESNLPLLTVQSDASVVSRGDVTKSDTYRVRLASPLKNVRALRLEALPDAGLPAGGPGRIYYEGPPGDFFMSEFTVKADGRPIKISRASESFSALPEVDPKNPKRLATRAAEAIDGEPSSGWSINGGQGRMQYAVFTFAEPIDVAETLDVEMLFERHYACGLGRFRLAITDETPAVDAGRLPPDVEAALAVPAERRSDSEQTLLRRYFLGIAPELAAAKREIEALHKRLPRLPTTLVMLERPADERRPTFVHKRGEYLQPAAPVEPAALAFLPPQDIRAVDRLGLARWLVDVRNPLVPRVTVNRHWAAFFGKGIVTTVDDFGYQGAPPTHPELLDWLAAEFVTPGDAKAWSVKRLHRLIVLSATYRQSSTISADAARLDPDGALLSRSPRLRLDAEVIRDAALQAAGLLTTKIGGPSVYPPQPASVTEAAYGKFAWKASTGSDRYRRSVYTFSKRTAPFAMFANFDAPSGELCVPRRDVSNTPLQALNLLNDGMIMEAAEALGKLIAAHSGDDYTKLEHLFRRILTRAPSPDEARDLLEFFRSERAQAAIAAAAARSAESAKLKQSDGEAMMPDPEVRAWMLTARVLLNLDEAVTRN